jgi:hypothetical protein
MKGPATKTQWADASGFPRGTAEAPGTERLIEAVVQVGPMETSYVRAGHGFPVLLLTGSHPVEDSVLPLLGRLSDHFRVIALSPPRKRSGGGQGESSPTLHGWLDGVLEGLGIERAALVIAVPLEGRLVRFLDDPCTGIDRIVVLDMATADAAARASLEGVEPRRPLLLLDAHPSGVPSSELEPVVRFLSEGAGSSPP